MVHHLQANFVLDLRRHIFCLLHRLLPHSAVTLLALALVYMAESRKLNPVRCRVPLEVEHGVDGLDLNPPTSLLHGCSDEIRVVAVADDELVAILSVCIFEGNLTDCPFEDIRDFAPTTALLLLGLYLKLVLLELHGVEVVGVGVD